MYILKKSLDFPFFQKTRIRKAATLPSNQGGVTCLPLSDRNPFGNYPVIPPWILPAAAGAARTTHGHLPLPKWGAPCPPGQAGGDPDQEPRRGQPTG